MKTNLQSSALNTGFPREMGNLFILVFMYTYIYAQAKPPSENNNYLK